MNMFLKVLSRFGSKILSSSLRFKVTACGLITCARLVVFCRRSSGLKIHFAFTCFPVLWQYTPPVFLKQSNNQSSCRGQRLRVFCLRLLQVRMWLWCPKSSYVANTKPLHPNRGVWVFKFDAAQAFAVLLALAACSELRKFSTSRAIFPMKACKE